MTGWWLNGCPVDLGELYLHENWDFLSPRAVHLYYSVPLKDIISNINSTGSMLYPCLVPTLKSMDVSILPMMRLTMLFSYMCLISEHSLGGAPYFPIMAMSIVWLEVSKSLTRSANATYFGVFWLFLICRIVLS